MARRKPTVSEMLFLGEDADTSPFEVRTSPTVERAAGRKTMARRKGDRPRDLERRVAPQVSLSVNRPGAVQRAYDVLGAIPGGRAATDAFEGLTGAREAYDALIRGAASTLGSDVYDRNRDLQAEDALTVGILGAAGPAMSALGRAGRRLYRALPSGMRTRVESLAARAPVSRDIPRERVFSVTAEDTPGAASQHRADILGSDFAARQRYGQQASWMRQTPEGEAYDVMYAAQGIPQRPAEEASGAYINSRNVMENNPVYVTQLDVGGEPSAEMLARIRATENLRGLTSAQEAMAGNMPLLDEGGDALLYRMAGQPSVEQMSRTARAIGEMPFGMTATSQGGLLVPFGDAPVRRTPELVPMLEELARIYPEAETAQVRNVGFFDPALGKSEGYDILPTEPFSGEATLQTLRTLADAPPSASLDLSSSPEVRDFFRSQIARDVGAPGVREDLQNTRRFFADENWQAAVELIRRGVSPAAALAALGISTTALAAPERE